MKPLHQPPTASTLPQTTIPPTLTVKSLSAVAVALPVAWTVAKLGLEETTQVTGMDMPASLVSFISRGVTLHRVSSRG